jgi:hypothetical protein
LSFFGKGFILGAFTLLGKTMGNTLINLLVIILVVGSAALFIFAYVKNKRRQSTSPLNEKTFRESLDQQPFSPDRLCFFGGTGMALKNGDDRIALQSRGKLALYPLADILDIKTFQTTATARPLGAAPGVVEVREFALFNLELRLKDVAEPVRIRLQDEPTMLQWEHDLKQLTNSL